MEIFNVCDATRMLTRSALPLATKGTQEWTLIFHKYL